MAEVVRFRGMDILQIQVAPDHIHSIPVEAIGSWAELLGLETVEEVITAMDHVRINGEPEPDWETGVNTWTEAYLALGEELDAEDAAILPETYSNGRPFVPAAEAEVMARAGIRGAENAKIHPRDRARIARERRVEVAARTREKLLGKGLDVPANQRAAGGPVIRPPQARKAFVDEATAALKGKGFDMSESRRKFKNGLRHIPR